MGALKTKQASNVFLLCGCNDIAVFLVYFYFTSGPRMLTSLFYHGNGSSRPCVEVFIFAACKLFWLNKFSSTSSSVLLTKQLYMVSVNRILPTEPSLNCWVNSGSGKQVNSVQNAFNFERRWTTLQRLWGKSDLGKVLKWRKIKCPLTLCIWLQAIKQNRNTASKKYTGQLNLDQNSSSHVSCDVIGFDWWRISKIVHDWIKPTLHAAGDKSPSRWGQLPEPEMRKERLKESLISRVLV